MGAPHLPDRYPETCPRCQGWVWHRSSPCECKEPPNENAIHEWFGLSYANYLVLPRSVMQSMPAEWQERMIAVLEECSARLGKHYEANVYDVRLLADGKRAPDPLADYRHTRLATEQSE